MRRVHMVMTGGFTWCGRNYYRNPAVQKAVNRADVTCLQCLQALIAEKEEQARSLQRDAARIRIQWWKVRKGVDLK